MEGRKEAFRMYLEESGTAEALKNVFIKLYELKDQRPDNEEDALKFMKDNLSDDFPSQSDYDNLLKQVQDSRKKVAAIRKAKEEAQLRAEVERQPVNWKKALRAYADVVEGIDEARIAVVVIKTIADAKARLEQLKRNRNCKSLLVECLELNVLENPDTDYLDALLLCIRRGLEDPNIPVGIYAAAQDDYVKFKAIFVPIITKYFGEISPVKSGWRNNADDISLNFRSHLLLAIRMTCARSIATFPFVPAMDSVQLKKLKTEVEAELKILTPDVKGRCLDFNKLQPKLKEKLQKNRLLPEPENKQLKAAVDVDNSIDFSKVRTIFCNGKKNLVVWVNEEEHLKFIATGKGSVKEPFIRLRKVVESCGFLRYTRGEGETVSTNCYLTFCPTFLGPAIHVSATVKWANVLTRGNVKGMMETNEICVKPTKVRDQFEVTNKPKLDMNEFEAVENFIAEVKALLEQAQIKTTDEAVARLQELKALSSPPKSLLVKSLTDELFNELKGDNEATRRTFLNCIRLGLEDEQLPLGIYAATPECYVTLKKLFDPIISEYSGTDLASIVPSKWDPAAPADNKKLNFKSHLILRTRITCAKSIEKYAFVPAMKNEKLKELRAKVTAALRGSAFAANCPGTTVDLDQLDEDVKAELEKKRLLFEAENVRLKAAGVTDFSEGRAIFYSTDKNLVVWVNEEEHLKFIATGTNTGSDGIFKDTFNRMRTVVKHCEAKLAFKESGEATVPKKCHLTFCPTFLGPAIHVSAVLKFPNVAAREKVEEMTKKMQICVKPTKVDDQFEVTNKPKLDKTEFEAVKDFIAEVKTLLDAAQIKTMDDALARLKELRSLSPQPDSLLITQITDTILEAAKGNGQDTEKALVNCIRLGLEDEKLAVGIYAVEEDAYEKFPTIFEPIVKAFFELTDLNTLPVASKWTSDKAEVNLEIDKELAPSMINVRITCARSITSYRFVPAMSAKDLTELKDKVETELEGLSEEEVKGAYLDFTTLSPDDKEKLENEQLLPEPKNKRLKAAGVTDFASGRAVFCNNNKNLIVWVNEEEHLKFIAIGTNNISGNYGDFIEDTFNRLKTIVEHCDAKLAFKKSGDAAVPKQCHLTFCPKYLGAAIHVSVMVYLPKTALREKAEFLAKKLDICVKPAAEALHFKVTNKPRLDMTEFDAVKRFTEKVGKLVKAEGKLITSISEAMERWQKRVSGKHDLMISKSIPDDEAALQAIAEKGPTRNGKTLLDCIIPGLEDKQMGIFAADSDAYEIFNELFDKHVENIHGDKLAPLARGNDGWDGVLTQFHHAKIKACAKSVTITCRRSFKDFPFIPAMDATQLRELRARVKAILEAYDSAGTFHYLEGMDDETKNQLMDKKHWFEPVNERLRSVGVKDFTTGRAVFVSEDEKLIVWVCEEDHLKFISIDDGEDIGGAFERLKDAVAKFETQVFGRHAKWGWKTFCPTNLGTTIEVTVVLDLPKITAAVAAEADGNFGKYCKGNIVISGANIDLATSEFCVKQLGTSSEYEISNKKKFGKEIDLVRAVYDGAAAVVVHEGDLS